MNIYQKLIDVRKSVPYIQKADKGAQYNYTGSSRVLAALREKMDDLGLLLVPSVTKSILHESPIEFKDASGNVTKRTITYFTELEMTMTWINAEDPKEQITSSWYGQGVDIAGEKGVGKALTYAEKYFLLKFFNIATDKDDPDEFQAKHDNAPEPQKGKKQQSNQEINIEQIDEDLAAIEAASNERTSKLGIMITPVIKGRYQAVFGSLDGIEKYVSAFKTEKDLNNELSRRLHEKAKGA